MNLGRSGNGARHTRWGVALLAAAAALLIGAAALPARHVMAQDTTTSTGGTGPARTITVTGVGKVRVEPDIARINIGVEVARPTVAEASAANNEIVQGVIEAIQGAGVAEKDVQTSGFSVYAERFGASGPVPDDQVQYRVSNNVAVVVRDLKSVSAVLEAAIDAGANNIYGVEFAVGDPSAYESDAMARAVDNANAKATHLADLTGLTLGEIISVSEGVNVNPLLLGTNQAMGLGGGGGPTVQPGVLELGLQLTVVYAAD